MKFFSNLIVIILAITIFAVMFAGAYFLFKYAATTISTLEHQVAVVTVFVCLTLLISALLIANSISRLIKERKLYEGKAVLYHAMIDVWSGVLDGVISYDDVVFRQMEHQMVISAEPAILKSHQSIIKLLKTKGAQDTELRSQLVKMILGMRKDIGLNNDNIKNEDIARLLYGFNEATAGQGAVQSNKT